MILNQVLHGYKDGHTLLASSIDLEADAKRQMLPMSDMSGGGIVAGFEEYITGYPLKQMNLYALAKTWYAPEMKRPGCVWTHTLLINFSDLPNIDNIFLLLSLFKRPLSPEINLGDYSNSLVKNFDSINIDTGRYVQLETDSHKGLIRQILKSLYGDVEKPILIKASSSLQLEQWILKIWSQQWPRLRRNFSFCSGSIAPRSFAGMLLDLQVVPYKLETLLSKNSVVIADNNKIEEGNHEVWIELAYKDLCDSNYQLKVYFNLFGSELPLHRSYFKHLAESFIFFKNSKPALEECIQFLAQTFPSNQVANNLKFAVLGNQNKPLGNLLPTYQEPAIIYHLTITRHYKSFNYVKLNYFNRFRSIFKDLNESSVKILKQIIKHGPNSCGEEAISDLANLLGENSYLQLLWKDKQLTSIFISINPRLTYNREYWLSNATNQVEIINQLQKPEINSKVDWAVIMKLLIETDSNIDLDIFGDQGLKVEPVILNWINTTNAPRPRNNWLVYLKRNPTAVLEWLNRQEDIKRHVVEVIVSILNPNSHIVVKNGLNPWLNYLSKLSKTRFEDVSIEVHSFCLALAFNIDSEESQKIFELTFERVYFALAMDKLEYPLWRELEKHTKPLSFWKDWDKCKKITNALVDQYIKNDWSMKKMIEHVYNSDLSDRILQRYKKRRLV